MNERELWLVTPIVIKASPGIYESIIKVVIYFKSKKLDLVHFTYLVGSFTESWFKYARIHVMDMYIKYLRRKNENAKQYITSDSRERALFGILLFRINKTFKPFIILGILSDFHFQPQTATYIPFALSNCSFMVDVP